MLYRRTLWQSYLCGCLWWTLLFWSDLTKPAIAIASVDRFYLNLIICVQLDIALLIHNSVKIWRCLPELWQRMQGFTFSLDTVYAVAEGFPIYFHTTEIQLDTSVNLVVMFLLVKTVTDCSRLAEFSLRTRHVSLNSACQHANVCNLWPRRERPCMAT